MNCGRHSSFTKEQPWAKAPRISLKRDQTLHMFLKENYRKMLPAVYTAWRRSLVRRSAGRCAAVCRPLVLWGALAGRLCCCIPIKRVPIKRRHECATSTCHDLRWQPRVDCKARRRFKFAPVDAERSRVHISARTFPEQPINASDCLVRPTA